MKECLRDYFRKGNAFPQIQISDLKPKCARRPQLFRGSQCVKRDQAACEHRCGFGWLRNKPVSTVRPEYCSQVYPPARLTGKSESKGLKVKGHVENYDRWETCVMPGQRGFLVGYKWTTKPSSSQNWAPSHEGLVALHLICWRHIYWMSESLSRIKFPNM